MADRSSGYVDNWQSGKSLSQCNLHMLEEEDSCDVRFLVGPNEIRISAHRYILISRSCVFHAMLCGPLAEKDDIKVLDVSDKLFKDFLIFLYTDDTELTPSNVTGLLYLAKKYAVDCLKSRCLTYLESSLSRDNACTILEQAHGFDEKTLFDKALDVATQHGEVSLSSFGFIDLCHGCLDKVISSENLAVHASEVFSAARLWAEAECKRQGRDTTPDMKRLVLGESIFNISFPTMDMKEFVQIVVPSQILTHEEHTKIFSYFACPELDISPFKVKKVRNEKQILFYENQKDVTLGLLSQEAVSVSCTSDVTVKSLLLYGSKTQGTSSCKLWFWKLGEGINIIDNEPLTVKAHSAKFNTHVADLPRPVSLTKNTDYGFEVYMDDPYVLRTLGNDCKTRIKAGSTTFSVGNYRGTSGLIAGLVLLPNQ